MANEDDRKALTDLMDKLNLINMSFLYKNQNVPFVDRAINPQNYPAPTIYNDEGKMQTHLLSASPDENNDWFVYPNIIYANGEYKKLNINEDQAVELSKQTGNLIPFGKDKEKAIEFSKNYKSETFMDFYKKLLQR